MQPGDTIEPTESADRTARPEIPKPPPDETPTQSATPPDKPETPLPAETDDANDSNPWQYTNESESPALSPVSADITPVSWSASEFVDHEKNNIWFVQLAALTGVIVAIIYFVTRDIITVVAIVLAASLFGVTAKRKPRTLQYQVDQAGISIGGKLYPYETLKSFAVLEEGALNSIQLTSLQRFMPPISLYYPPESEGQIIAMISNYLPHEERTHDPIDRLMRKVRF